MKLMLRFLRPHWKLTALTMALLILDVTGALFVPTLVAEMLKRAEGGPDYDGLCYMSQSACRDEAETLAAMIEKAMPKLAGKIRIYDIGTVIGSHTGPGTVAVFFTGKEKEE